MQKRNRRSGSDGRSPRQEPVPFGRRIARRQYVWRPPVGRRREVDLEIGTPAQFGRKREWACRFRITGLPTPIDESAHGFDALQALELALIWAGRLLSQSPQFRAGQIEIFDAPVKNAAELFLPLPMNALQLALENLRAYLERQREKERKTKRDWFHSGWGRTLSAMMREISGDLATLAAHLPIEPRSPTRRKRGQGGQDRWRRRRPPAGRTTRNR
jgi:hypothetical protein